MLVLAGLNSISLSFLYNALFERRLKRSVHWCCLFATIPVFCMCLVGIPMGTSLLRVAAYLMVDFFILCLFQGKFLVRLCIAVLHYFISTALETIFLPTILTLGKLPLDQLWQEPILAVLVYLSPIVITFVCCLFLGRNLRRWKKQIELPASEWLAIFLFAMFTFFEMYFASILISTDSALMPLLPILGFVLLFMNVALLLLLDKLAAHHRMEQENLALQEQMHYNRLSMQAAAESYDTQRSLTHDFDNHLLTVVQLLQSGQCQEALTYAQTVRMNVLGTDVAVSTNNPIADAVLNQKYRKAQELGVQMQFLVSDLSSFPLTTDEMVTVLANLLDNALEACVRDSSTQKRSIRVKLLMESALATLSVQNTSLPVIISQNGDVSTSKQKQSEHGYGLRNCKKILRRSGFNFAVRYKDGWFQFTAIKAL